MKDFALSDCVYWEKNVNGDCGGRVEQSGEGLITCENCRNRTGQVTIHKVHFLESEIVDGEYGDTDTHTEEFTDLTLPEAVAALRREGLSFRATGNEWAADPDGSYILNYATGERVETTGHLSGFPDWMVREIQEQVG